MYHDHVRFSCLSPGFFWSLCDPLRQAVWRQHELLANIASTSDWRIKTHFLYFVIRRCPENLAAISVPAYRVEEINYLEWIFPEFTGDAGLFGTCQVCIFSESFAVCCSPGSLYSRRERPTCMGLG